MSDNQNPYDPTEMFKDWIQKSGNAQAEFIRNFGSLMTNQTSGTFDPLVTLREVSEKTKDAQAAMMENMASMQNRGMDTMLSMGRMLPSFVDWGAYKTTVGSNGRISIPEAERTALGLEEGDLVQVIVLPVAGKSKKREVKQ